jgi:hypothetical protein
LLPPIIFAEATLNLWSEKAFSAHLSNQIIKTYLSDICRLIVLV